MKKVTNDQDYKQYKKWSLMSLLITFCLLLSVIIPTVIVDPFFQYHKPHQNISYIINNQPHQNPGIVKNFDYDSLSTGSSMTANFKTSWFYETEGLNTIKVPYSAGVSFNFKTIIELAIQNNPSIKKIYLGLDLDYLVNYKPNDSVIRIPEYLYDNNLFNDVNYVLNKDVIFDYIFPIYKRTINNVPATSFDEYSAWPSSYRFGMHQLTDRFNFRDIEENPGSPQENSYLNNSRLILETNILPIIEAYPDIQFVLFDPPYSILYWYNLTRSRVLFDSMIQTREYIASRLVEYPNVEYYVFNDERIIGNLYNYLDISHYSPNVSHYIAQCFANKKHLLTKDNYAEEINKFRIIADNFDYSVFYREENPLFSASSITAYLDLLKDDRYTFFIAANCPPDTEIPEYILTKFKELGLNPDFSSDYIAVVDNGNILIELASDSDIERTVQVGDKIVHLYSLNSENLVEITIEDILPEAVSYSKNETGISIVVYDKALGRVTDNAHLELTDGFPMIR